MKNLIGRVITKKDVDERILTLMNIRHLLGRDKEESGICISEDNLSELLPLIKRLNDPITQEFEKVYTVSIGYSDSIIFTKDNASECVGKLDKFFSGRTFRREIKSLEFIDGNLINKGTCDEGVIRYYDNRMIFDRVETRLMVELEIALVFNEVTICINSDSHIFFSEDILCIKSVNGNLGYIFTAIK